jgi:hypothetical protein
MHRRATNVNSSGGLEVLAVGLLLLMLLSALVP